MNLIIGLIIALSLYKIVELIYHHYWNKNLSVSVKISKNEAYAGEELSIYETVANNKWLALPLLILSFYTSKYLVFEDTANSTLTYNNYRNHFIPVLKHQRIKHEIKFTCSHRGVYIIDNIVLVAYNLFFDNKEVV